VRGDQLRPGNKRNTGGASRKTKSSKKIGPVQNESPAEYTPFEPVEHQGTKNCRPTTVKKRAMESDKERSQQKIRPEEKGGDGRSKLSKKKKRVEIVAVNSAQCVPQTVKKRG